MTDQAYPANQVVAILTALSMDEYPLYREVLETMTEQERLEATAAIGKVALFYMSELGYDVNDILTRIALFHQIKGQN